MQARTSYSPIKIKKDVNNEILYRMCIMLTREAHYFCIVHHCFPICYGLFFHYSSDNCSMIQQHGIIHVHSVYGGL